MEYCSTVLRQCFHFTLELTIHTRPILTDAQGNTADVYNAERISEEFESVEIRPLSKSCLSSTRLNQTNE
jgi:hypothetical protein